MALLSRFVKVCRTASAATYRVKYSGWTSRLTSVVSAIGRISSPACSISSDAEVTLRTRAASSRSSRADSKMSLTRRTSRSVLLVAISTMRWTRVGSMPSLPVPINPKAPRIAVRGVRNS
jgi:hypothetical protein